MFLALIAAVRDLPPPRANTKVNGYEVDFVWPDERLIVETDGWETHGTRTAFENDKRRDAAHTQAGYRVLRFSWRQVKYEPATVKAAVRRALR
jgi:very-short-patch-repair endonuclease